ncbi:hypothetical protein QMK38_18470 [Lysinibacillus fusiformis]|nr:hypothetical protein [Lysinibacillus fusiformis]
MKGNFMKGFTFTALMSMPLWISIFGWAKLMTHFLTTIQLAADGSNKYAFIHLMMLIKTLI